MPNNQIALHKNDLDCTLRADHNYILGKQQTVNRSAIRQRVVV